MFMALYDPDKTGDKRVIVANVLTDKVFTEPARYLAARQTALGQSTYRYVFAYVPREQRAGSPGAGHGAEIQFVFGTLGTFHGSPKGYTDEDRKVAADMGRYWTNFAKTGNPNADGLIVWPADKADQILLIDKTGEHAESRFHKPRLDVMAARAAQ
jgi:para-nitrobenzyl esterase